MDDGSFLIAVLLKSSSSKPSMSPKFSGNCSSPEQPLSFSFLRDVNPQMLPERHPISVHQLRSNREMLVECSINDKGILSMPVPSNQSSDSFSIFTVNSGISLTFVQDDRIRMCSASVSSLPGRLLMLIQDFRFRRESLFRNPIDG